MIQCRISRLCVVSGGQTGADRAALDWAIESGIAYEGWCPQGRLAEDGVIPSNYHLKETPSAEYSQRTEWNVRDSEGTVLFTISPELKGGTALAWEYCGKLHKPVLHLAAKNTSLNPARLLLSFIKKNKISKLNVAGSRHSEEPAVGDFVKKILSEAFDPEAPSRFSEV